MIRELTAKFSLDKYSLAAITGGGGKTSLMYALGRYFAEKEKVLVTTTAHIRPPREGECGVFLTGAAEEFEAEAAKLPCPVLLAAARGYEGEKLCGFKPEEIDSISANGVFDRVIVEADGSQGLSFKVYEEWEPPVPASASCQIVVAGADALAAPASSASIFRFYLLSARYQIARGERLSAMNFASILSSRAEYLKNSPDKAFRLLLLNKCELLSDREREEACSSLPKLLRGYDGFAAVSMQENELFAAAELSR